MPPGLPESLPCPSCKVERDVAGLENGCCVFCGLDLVTLYTAPGPKTAPKTGRKAPRKVQLAPTPVPDPEKAPEPAPALEAGLPASPTAPPATASAPEAAAYRMPYEPPQSGEEQEHDLKRSAERVAAERTLRRRRLMPFIKAFRPKYNAGWVHEDICQRLEQFVKDVEAGLEPRVLLMMPPRAGKSEIGSRHFPAWVLGHHPEWEIIAASHTSSLTMSFSRYVRDLIRDPLYARTFPGTQLDPSSQSVENWNIVGGGGYLAAGVGTGITGRGAHILLLDDLVKDIEAADSQTIKDNTWEWYASTAYTRLAPGGGVLGIMTWWSEDDWAGRIQQVMASGEGDKFEIIRYPAVNDLGDEYILDDQPHRPIVQVPREPDGARAPAPSPGARLVRELNTAIHPARYTTEAMLRIKRNLYAAGQQRVWNALYQQNPLPDDGLYFTKDMFRYYSTPPHPSRCHVYQAWDFAITEGAENDYTVGATLMQDERDALYVVDIRRFKSADSFVIVDEILDYAKQWGATTLGFEDGQIWKALQAVFDKRCEERKQYPSYEVLKPLTDKMVRASPLRGRMQLGKVYFDEKAPWFRDLYMELTRFPAGKHDDQIDALAWATRLTLTNSAPRPQEFAQRKLPSWKDRLGAYTEGVAGATHMSA